MARRRSRTNIAARGNGRGCYFRQLWDALLFGIIEDWNTTTLREWGKLSGWALARAYARSGDSARIAGYLGSNSTFDGAIG